MNIMYKFNTLFIIVEHMDAHRLGMKVPMFLSKMWVPNMRFVGLNVTKFQHNVESHSQA